MSMDVKIKIEYKDPPDVKEDVKLNSDEDLGSQIFCDNFVGIKQEITDINIKSEPEDHSYEEDDLSAENVLIKLESELFEDGEITRKSRKRVIDYREDESDEDYMPLCKSSKKKRVHNVKRVFKGRSKKDDVTYSLEIIKDIEIVTIDEETRVIEHNDLLNSRRHMNYTCDLCALGFVVEEAYHMHMKIHSPETGDYECDICKSRMKSEDVLYRHKLRHYRRYRCSICFLQLRDKDTVAAHIMSEHLGTSFVCRHCKRDFKRPQYLKRHVDQMHTKPLHLECPVCHRVFHERGWYRCHVRTHNEQVKQNNNCKAVCSHCGREFRKKQYLVRHLHVHEDRRPATCSLCKRTFKNIEVLRVHRRQHHGKNPIRDYAPNNSDGESCNTPSSRVPRLSIDTTCHICGRVLTTRAMLARHTQRMHTDRIRKFQCDYCQKCFFSKAEVRSHIEWTHLHQRKHACGCGRVFRTPARLRAHNVAAHLQIEQPRDKSCPVCGKLFANQQVLSRHIKAHSGKTYPCQECGQKFKTQSYVKVHYKIKHLNMTRAQVKAQSKRKLLMINNVDEIMNAKVKVGKKAASNTEDPLNVENCKDTNVVVKKEIPEISVPLFETFVDIQREF